MACCFAGDASSLDKLWDLVWNGCDAWSPVPAERFNHHMLPLENAHRSVLEQHMTRPQTFVGDVLFVSPVAGTQVKNASQLGPEHWAWNMAHPVLFSDFWQCGCYGAHGRQHSIACRRCR